MSQPEYQRGDQVRDRYHPGEPGTVLGVDYDDQLDEWFVSVRFGTRRVSVEASRLEAWEDAPDAWRDIERMVTRSASELLEMLTYERIRVPSGPAGASFGSARAKLYTYQFKPLVKFLENPRHALLIADEVGLGKTIEAGYIHREWKLRHKVESVLIVVPARLRTKWRDELSVRFDERFEIVGHREVLAMMNRVRAGKDLQEFQWIASYESLRREDVIHALREVLPPLDLVILDEAHRVRNPGTLQHALARVLSECAQAQVFLTATPLQTGLGNLHTLLDLLDPGAFGREADFQGFIDANRPLVRAATLAARGQFRDAAHQLAELANNPLTARLGQHQVVRDLVEELRNEPTPSRAKRVEMQAVLGELSLTGHLVTRTRKSDVFQDRPVRSPQTEIVFLTPEERRVYDAVEVFTKTLYGQGGWAKNMAALTAYRYTASCIPAAIEYMRARLNAGGFTLDGEVDADFNEDPTLPSWDKKAEDHLAETLARPPVRDSKFEALLRVVSEIWRDDDDARQARRKIIVFSFFKRTLAWLERRFRDRRVGFERIDGDVPLDERAQRIDRFLTQRDCHMLLSSEVGGEGLDLQVASVVVNYDLPWNPMVVEQRIGRVDRIGQEASRLVIVNLVCHDTIEDRILLRLYERIHLFESSIGEIEEILGPREVGDLVLAHLRRELSAQELERQVDLTADATIRQARDAERLAEEVDGLLAADQAILDQLGQLLHGGRLPSPGHLAALTIGFLQRTYPGTRLDGDPARSVALLELTTEARTALNTWSEAGGGRARRLVGALRAGPVALTSDGDLATRHPRAEHLQVRHPLVQFVVDKLAERRAQAGTAYAARARVPEVQTGIWVVGLSSVTRRAEEIENNLVCAAALVGAATTLTGDDAEPILRALLGGAAELDPRPVLSPVELADAGRRARIGLAREHARVEHAVRAIAERRHLRRQATWGTTLMQQLQRAEEHLKRMREVGKPFAIRMGEVKAAKARAQYARVSEELHGPLSPRVETHEIAVVVLEVHP
jgi:superfamily II DNA or RNA helicase